MFLAQLRQRRRGSWDDDEELVEVEVEVEVEGRAFGRETERPMLLLLEVEDEGRCRLGRIHFGRGGTWGEAVDNTTRRRGEMRRGPRHTKKGKGSRRGCRGCVADDKRTLTLAGVRHLDLAL